MTFELNSTTRFTSIEMGEHINFKINLIKSLPFERFAFIFNLEEVSRS